MFCPLCESENPASSVRCRACGAKLAAREATTQSDSPDALPAGSVLGRLYHVEGVLGQGGFGITYRCRDQMLERAVAVKEFFPSGSRRAGVEVEPGRSFSSDDFREARSQFLLEARLLARCHHPGVVMVHTAFEENGTAYMVMELLHGQNLMQAMDARAGGKWSEEEALAPVERVGEALQYVHDQGLLHRDIKPENIVLCDDGRVMLLDFGTAREYVQGQSQGHTVTVTPGYAPLEQYARQAKRGAFTDVYGLAATLYFLLTGEPPPAASDRAMGVLVRPVREQNPRVSPGVASAVEAGLHMEIARRPQSVRAFLELLHAPASATRKSEAPAVVTPRWAQADSPEPSPSEIADFFAPQGFPAPTAPLSPAPFAPVALRPRNPDAPKPSLLRPPSASLPSQSTPAPSTPTTSYKPNWSSSNSSGGIGVQEPTDHSGAALGWIMGILLLFFIAYLSGQSSHPQSPPNPTIYSSSPGYSQPFDSGSSSSPSVAPTAAVVETLPGISPSLVQKLPVGAPSKSGGATLNNPQEEWAEFSLNGKWLAYRDAQNVVRVCDRHTRRVVRTMPQDKAHPVDKIAFSSAGDFLALTHTLKSVQATRVDVWNFRTGKMLGKVDFNPKTESFIVNTVRPDGQILFRQSSSSKGSVSIPLSLLWWNPRTGKKTFLMIQGRGEVVQAALSPDAKKLVTGGKSGRISWLDAQSGAPKAQSGTTLTLRQYQAASGDNSNTFSSLQLDEPLPVWGLRFSSNGSFLASRNVGEIRVFNQNSQEVGKIAAPFSPSFAVSPDGRMVVDGGVDPNVYKMGVRLFPVGGGQQARLLIPNPEGKNVGALSFSPDGKQVQGVVSSQTGVSLYTWPVNGQSQNQSAPPVVAPPSADKSLGAYSPSGTTSFEVAPNAMLALSDKFIASSAGDYAEIRRTNGSFLKQLDMIPEMGTATEIAKSASEFVLSPDGQVLGVRDPTGKTKLWKVESKEAPISFAALPPIQSHANSLAQNKNIVFSSDKRLAALAGIKGKREFVELWDLQKAPQRLALVEQDMPVSALAFSPDGRTLVVGHQDGSLQWLDAKTRKVMARSYVGPPHSSVLTISGSNEGWMVAQRSGETLAVVSYSPTESSPHSSNPLKAPSFTRKLSPRGIIGEAAVFSPDGRLLAVPTSSAQGNRIELWDVANGLYLRSLQVGKTESDNWPWIAPITFSPDGKRISCLNLDSNRTELTTWQRSPSRGTGF